MLGKINKILTSVPATVVGGMFLVLSLLEVKVLIDPAWVTVTISGLPLLYSAVRKLAVNKGITRISSALLISVAMIAAICIDDLFAAGEVAFIMAIGEILEDKTTSRAQKGLKNLLDLAPVQGRLIVDGVEKNVLAVEIKEGDILRVLSGETIPVDGVIIKGSTAVDQSVITGESLPVDKAVGDDVYSGTVNCFGVIEIKATKVGENSSLQKLIRLVKAAEKEKAPMARVADKSAGWLVPVALLVALITLIVTKSITRAVTVLVVFCPCALVLATPTAIMAAIGQATKHGVIIKSGAALENMGKSNLIALDKTGTLTHGEPVVCDIITLNPSVIEEQLLAIAASAETQSEHPLGKAIVSCAADKKISLSPITQFVMTAGKGVQANISGTEVLCGSERYLAEKGVVLETTVVKAASKLRDEGKVTLLVAADKAVQGMIALSDTMRSQSESVVSALKSAGASVVLLTGDSNKTASYFGKQAGISTVLSELLPQDKVAHIQRLKREGNTVCMVGDGVNDAPALKAADVGVAMGAVGSDIAVEAADIALMGDDLSSLTYLKRLASATVKTIRFSIALSMLINILAVALSVAGMLNPTTGALVHNAGSCFVILIAALLYDRKF